MVQLDQTCIDKQSCCKLTTCLRLPGTVFILQISSSERECRQSIEQGGCCLCVCMYVLKYLAEALLTSLFLTNHIHGGII